MSILFAGSPENAALVLSELLDKGVEIAVVLTRTDKPQGRKRVLTETPVASLAKSKGIPVIKTNVVDQAVIEQIVDRGVELAVVVAYGVLLKANAISALSKGWFNLHFSLLPRYRGAAPVQRSLMAGDSETGVSIFKIDEGLDTGPIVATLPVLVEPDETADDLLKRMSLLGSTLFAETLPKLVAGIVELSPQRGEPSIASKLGRFDGLLSFQESNSKTYFRYRAVTSEPGAWANLGSQPLKIVAMKFSREDLGLEPGEFTLKDGKVLVQCGDGMLELLQVQPAGKSSMSAGDWIRGLREIRKFSH